MPRDKRQGETRRRRRRGPRAYSRSSEMSRAMHR